MNAATAQAILERAAREKKAEDPTKPLNALKERTAQQLREKALHNIWNVAKLSLGVGASSRGLVGLINYFQDKDHKPKHRGGPTDLSLPFPVKSGEEGWEEWGKKLFKGEKASTPGGIPWYGLGLMTAGMGSLAAGWKGIDMVIEHRRKSERDAELEQARQEYHDALLSQYGKPVHGLPHSATVKMHKAAEEPSTMIKVGEELDLLYDDLEKTAKIDLNNMAGGALNAYGVYAGLTSLLTGMAVYDKLKKRSHRAVLEKALQRRERRRFSQQPTELYAHPEPIELPLDDDEEKIGSVLARFARS